jgi:hypothetical protein
MKTFAPVNLGVVLLRLAAQLSVTFTHSWTGLEAVRCGLPSITLLPTSGLMTRHICADQLVTSSHFACGEAADHTFRLVRHLLATKLSVQIQRNSRLRGVSGRLRLIF